MNFRYFSEMIISLFIILNFLTVIESNKERIESREEEKRFIKCLENNSLTNCLILLFINEKQEKLLLQIQNELSK